MSSDEWGNQTIRTREIQAREFHEAFRPGYDGYLGLGVVWLPVPGQSQWQSPYGLHEGFAFRHRLALLVLDTVRSARRIGLAWWGERHGFDREDFLFFPAYGRFGGVRSVHTLAVGTTDDRVDYGLALGMQWSHPEYLGAWIPAEKDSVYWFSEVDWTRFGAQIVWENLRWRALRLNADLADRALRGGDSAGWRTYLPDLEFYLLSSGADPLRISWRQNLYGQQVYALVRSWPVERRRLEGVLQMYVHPSQMAGAEFGVRRLETGLWFWGIGLELPFLRVAYNLPRDADAFLGARNTWIIEVQLSVGSRRNRDFFALNAARGAPMETKTKVRPASVGEAQKSRQRK